MITCGLLDQSFYGDKSSSKKFTPRHIKWDRLNLDQEYIFFTDQCLHLIDNFKHLKGKKIAWILEPPVIDPRPYQTLGQYKDKFDLVLTHFKELTNYPGVEYYPFGNSWVEESDWRKYLKNKDFSMIASHKGHTEGHRIRHEIYNKLSNQIDTYGSICNNWIDEKTDALRDYRFSIAIENCSIGGYFTEKIIDCFATYTVPIYWGDPDISIAGFNKQGIIFLDRDNPILPDSPKELYNNMLPYIEENFEVAKKFQVPEDNIYLDYLK